MNTIKNIILECDFFAHSTFQRYKEEESYRTLMGGVISIVLVILFIAVFFSLAISTLTHSIIFSSTSTSYLSDPSFSQLKAHPSQFMFAIGITGIDLSSSQRYFDISFVNRSFAKNGTSTVKTRDSIPLQPCTSDQWSGNTDGIQSSFDTLGFSQWLCPPKGQEIPLQGKFTSQNFKFAQIVVSACTNNSLYPNTTCRSTSDVSSLVSAFGGELTFNFYFINPVLNPGKEQFVSYYLDDSNYFTFNMLEGVESNLYFSNYEVITDTTILPVEQKQSVQGILSDQPAVTRNFQIDPLDNQYFKLFLRKAAKQIEAERSFQKLDQTLSYIGGLFGTLILLLLFLNLYSKYSYELDLGDCIFKENNNGSFGSENFNFIVFLGYLVFVFFSKFGIILNWKTMKKFHRCRSECEKQLNIDFWFKKIAYLEEVAKTVLQQHQLKMLLMLPKPTISETRLNRKRFLIKTIIYSQLQRKARDIQVEQDEFKNKLQQFVKRETNSQDKNSKNKDMIQDLGIKEATMKAIQDDIVQSYKKVKEETQNNKGLSAKIFNKISVEEITEALFNFILPEFTGVRVSKAENTEEEIRKMPLFQPFQMLQDIDQSIVSAKLENNECLSQTKRVPSQQFRKSM